jgi:hypothetical protein
LHISLERHTRRSIVEVGQEQSAPRFLPTPRSERATARTTVALMAAHRLQATAASVAGTVRVNA